MRKSSTIKLTKKLSAHIKELTVQEVVLFLAGMDRKPFTDEEVNKYLSENPSIIINGARSMIEFSSGDFESQLLQHSEQIIDEFRKVNSAWFLDDNNNEKTKNKSSRFSDTALKNCNKLVLQVNALIIQGHSNCYDYGWWFFIQILKANNDG